MKIFPMVGLVLLFLSGQGLMAEEMDFGLDFKTEQGAHPKAKGRLKEGYGISSYFSFHIPKGDRDWSGLGAGYLKNIQPGFSHLPGQNEQPDQAIKVEAIFPCDAQYIFFRAKGIEEKGVKEGVESLSGPERSIYRFSKTYIKDPGRISFERTLKQGLQLDWQSIADHFKRQGKPLWVFEEYFDDFNQFAIEAWAKTVIFPAGDEYEVLGEIKLVLDADLLDKRVMGLILSMPLKAALRGTIPTRIVFGKVAEKLKSAESLPSFNCQDDASNQASLIYGVPNFYKSYLEHLRQYLLQEN